MPCSRRVVLAIVLGTVGLFHPLKVTTFQQEDAFTVIPWPDGIVYYRFDDGTEGPKAVTPNHQSNVRDEMANWTTAMTVADPYTGVGRPYIQFVECTTCTEDVVVIRYNKDFEEGSNICTIGTLPGQPAKLRMDEGVFGNCPSCPNTIRHELGHCLGLWHEFNRADADRWLIEDPDVDGADFEREFSNSPDRAALMPIVGNYDYDSLMHYSELPDDGEPTFTDRRFFRFGRVNLDAAGLLISPGNKSRLMQYYTRGSNPNWGFFKSLSGSPILPNRDLPPRLRLAMERAAADVDRPPDPRLAPGIEPLGTPAIVLQTEDNIDFFVRGSNRDLYWAASRDGEDFPRRWQTLGNGYISDPAAISRANGTIDVFIVHESEGLVWKRYENGVWRRQLMVRGGGPGGGFKEAPGGGVFAPAVASRTADTLEVFVVRTDGRLGVTSLINAEWTNWTSLGLNYDVTASPAALALSPTKVQLAINESDDNLYEPTLVIDALPPFVMGAPTAATWPGAAPALAKRDDPDLPYRVLIVNTEGRLSHRFGPGATRTWIDIGGIPQPGTGPAAVAAGRFGAYILMHGEDAFGCVWACEGGPAAHDPFIQSGGLWLRRFE